MLYNSSEENKKLYLIITKSYDSLIINLSIIQPKQVAEEWDIVWFSERNKKFPSSYKNAEKYFILPSAPKTSLISIIFLDRRIIVNTFCAIRQIKR